jgi:Ni,Fe-hydrogenase III large subunit
MKLERQNIDIGDLSNSIKTFMDTRSGSRLGLLTSLDGGQIATVMLDPNSGSVEFWESQLESDSYKSVTPMVPQAHWFERIMWDMFGIVPEGHPRLKHVILHDPYASDYFPLRTAPRKGESEAAGDRVFQFLEVRGEGVHEVPLGPIHAGVIEPGHFRLSCLGETIMNLELKLGYVHRGVEKRLTEVPWQKARLVAESSASDSAAANALAHAIAIESLLDVQVSAYANHLRTVAIEIERLAAHILDLGGIGSEMGFLGFSQNMMRLREDALGLAQSLSGSRFMRGFIIPGGVMKTKEAYLSKIRTAAKALRKNLKVPLQLLQDSQTATERMEVADISRSLANEFGMVGVTARACGIDYDCRKHFSHGTYPEYAPAAAVEGGGDVLSRTRVRLREIDSSLDVIEAVLENLPGSENGSEAAANLPDLLPANAVGVGIVEAFRGELLHFVVTGADGTIRRYCIKDPSRNNWTAISIAVRNNLISDFPLCNKSLALSYSGNDL